MRLSIGALFSIYAKDHPEYLFEALWSAIRGQTIELDGVVGVIEGEIGDELEQIVAEFHEVQWIRISRTKNPHGFGLPEALNHGLAVLNTDIVLKVDTDDLNHEERAAITMEAFARNPKLVLFGGQVQEWDSQYTQCFGRRRVPCNHHQILQFAQIRNPFNGPSVAFSKSVIESLGGYPLVGANEDYALWAQVLASGFLSANHPEDLVYMRGGNDLVKRRSSMRTRKGELEALWRIGQTGLWSRGRLAYHIIGKQLVRRLPDSWNRYIYKKLRQTVPAEVPSMYMKARDAWNTFYL
mgnify:FL=1